jgi:putative phosphonate metabolism protein
MSPARYAVYFTPPPESPLAVFGAGVLGYDCSEWAEVPRHAIEDVDPSVLALVTVAPRRYGFHATLVAPFRLAQGTDEASLAQALSAFAARHTPIAVGPLRVVAMDRFVVLMPVEPYPAVETFAAACVTDFDRYRAPLTDADRARRASAAHTTRQGELLQRWGYPYVFDEFRFHMTLAGPLPEAQRGTVETGLARAFAPLARDHVEIGAISLMREDGPAARFGVVRRERLRGRLR